MLIEIIIGTVLAGLLGGGLVLKWDRIIITLKGKRLAVLGERGVGKTCLINFLTTGSLPESYNQTATPEKKPPRRFTLKDLDLKIKDTLDVPGDKDFYANWQEQCERADVILYLLRADRIIMGDKRSEARVKDDMGHIVGWLRDSDSAAEFFIIGTHCDLDPFFKQCISAGKMGDYANKFTKLEVVKYLVRLAGGTKKVRLVLGSMQDTQSTEELVFSIFCRIAS